MTSMRPPINRSLYRLSSLALAAGASLALAGTPAAQAGVAFPVPGVMRINGLPSHVRAGHTFTLREVMPVTVWFGKVRFERQTPSGAWRTLATAAIRPKVFWLHWWVPRSWGGTQIAVRFVALSHSQTLAMSPAYTIDLMKRH